MQTELIIRYDAECNVWDNGNNLAKQMQSQSRTLGLRGYFFDFGYGETTSHKNFSDAMKTHAGMLMGAARDTGASVRIFRNMNGQIAAALTR